MSASGILWVSGKPTTPTLIGLSLASRVPPMACAECGHIGIGIGAWTMRLDCDDGLHPFCESCDRREFKGA